MNKVIVFFDTETTGLLDFKADYTAKQQPDMVQIAATLWDEATLTIWTSLLAVIHPHEGADLAKPRQFTISSETEAIHRVSDAAALAFGQPRRTTLSTFSYMCKWADTIIAHNLDFDWQILLTAYHRENVPHRLSHLKKVCTMKAATPILKLPKAPGKYKSKPGDEYKWPKLQECYKHFFNEEFVGAHNAMNDVLAMMKVWRELRKIKAL